MKQLPNLNRYTFEGTVCTNRALGTPVAVQKLPNGGREYYRLTNDKGERIRLYLDQIPTDKPKAQKVGKLDMEKAKVIRAMIAAGEKVSQIAKDYQVNASAIYDIKSGRLYNDGSIVYTGKR